MPVGSTRLRMRSRCVRTPTGLRLSVEAEIGGGSKLKANSHVVVVDDDEGEAEVVSRLLRAAGYDVVAVGSGEEALELMRREPPRLVVLDELGVHSRAQAVAFAYRSNFVENSH